MSGVRYQHICGETENLYLSDRRTHFPLLKKNAMAITDGEKLMTAAEAAISGIGTAGLISTILWYATTPIAAAGLGMALGFAASVTALALVGAASIVIAIPIAVLVYRNQINNARRLQMELQNELIERERKRLKLFFACLKMRCVCAHDAEFDHIIEQIPVPESNKTELRQLIKTTYQYILSKEEHSIKHDMHDFKLEQKLAACFINSDQTINHYHGKAAAFGTVAGISAAGITLGTGWTFAALLIGAGLAVSVPFAGWALFAVCCIGVGVLFGIGVGLCKQKNLQREGCAKQLAKKNELLVEGRKQLAELTRTKMKKLQISEPLHNKEKYLHIASKKKPKKAHWMHGIFHRQFNKSPVRHKNINGFSVHRNAYQLSSVPLLADYRILPDSSRRSYGIH